MTLSICWGHQFWLTNDWPLAPPLPFWPPANSSSSETPTIGGALKFARLSPRLAELSDCWCCRLTLITNLHVACCSCSCGNNSSRCCGVLKLPLRILLGTPTCDLWISRRGFLWGSGSSLTSIDGWAINCCRRCSCIFSKVAWAENPLWQAGKRPTPAIPIPHDCIYIYTYIYILTALLFFSRAGDLQLQLLVLLLQLQLQLDLCDKNGREGRCTYGKNCQHTAAHKSSGYERFEHDTRPPDRYGFRFTTGRALGKMPNRRRNCVYWKCGAVF